MSGFDVQQIRKDFPILERTVHGEPLVYLDNAATSQKPRAVIDAITHYYAHCNANIHRGVHALGEEATQAYEGARAKVAAFLGAASAQEVVFVRGTTEAINLVAESFVRPLVRQGDEVLITHMEHHSNIVPWQLLREKTGLVLKVAPITDRGEVNLDAFARLLSPRTRFVSLVHVSNALGTINPVAEMVGLAHARGIPVLLDGAQAAPHLEIDVREIGCDFYAISGHKMYGPTGIGALWGRAELLEEMSPYQGGGEMILSVSFEKTTYHRVPHRFEAGTPNVAGAIGLGAAVDYLQSLEPAALRAHEEDLLAYGTRALEDVPELRLIGTAPHKTGVLSFVFGDVHPHDVGTILDREGIAVRSGHHCAQPVMDRFGIPATTRASLGLYNTRDDIDRLVRGLERVREIFR